MSSYTGTKILKHFVIYECNKRQNVPRTDTYTFFKNLKTIGASPIEKGVGSNFRWVG